MQLLQIQINPSLYMCPSGVESYRSFSPSPRWKLVICSSRLYFVQTVQGMMAGFWIFGNTFSNDHPTPSLASSAQSWQGNDCWRTLLATGQSLSLYLQPWMAQQCSVWTFLMAWSGILVLLVLRSEYLSFQKCQAPVDLESGKGKMKDMNWATLKSATLECKSGSWMDGDRCSMANGSRMSYNSLSWSEKTEFSRSWRVNESILTTRILSNWRVSNSWLKIWRILSFSKGTV